MRIGHQRRTSSSIGRPRDEVRERLAGQQQDADEEQQQARQELDRATHGGRVYGGIMRPMAARPGTSIAAPRPRPAAAADARSAPRCPRPRATRSSIARDRWGIPHVQAGGDGDAWFGARLLPRAGPRLPARAHRARRARAARRAARRAALPIDRLSRTLGFRRLAAGQVGVLDPDVRAELEAYVAGVNAAARALAPTARARAAARPPSALDRRGRARLSRAPVPGARRQLGHRARALSDPRCRWPRGAAAVEPTYPPWHPVMTPPGAAAGGAVDRLAADIARLRDLVGGPGASNAWAIAGVAHRVRGARSSPTTRTWHRRSRRPGTSPICARPTGRWPARRSSAARPSRPAHNGHAAWGITAACTDSADLFWEELSASRNRAAGPMGPSRSSGSSRRSRCEAARPSLPRCS